MEKLAAILFFLTLVGNTLEDGITANSAEVFSSEGRSVTLSCTYSVKADNLQWYRQDPGSAPQFLLLITDTKEPSVVEAKPPHPRLTAKLNEERNQVYLQISSAAVTDSAVYYCAVRPNTGNQYKIFFGSGTRLTVEPNEEYEPSYYEVKRDDTKACLATGFSRHNATLNHEYYEKFNKTKSVRIKDDSLYNQVALLSADEDGCEQSEAEPCEDTLEPDPMVNLVSLTVLGLRLIFLKTIVFNVLMTFRLWISQ